MEQQSAHINNDEQNMHATPKNAPLNGFVLSLIKFHSHLSLWSRTTKAHVVCTRVRNVARASKMPRTPRIRFVIVNWAH